MLDPTHGDIGWDVLTLEYRVDAPVDVIITSYAPLAVSKIVQHVVENQAGRISHWRKYITGARGVLWAIEDKVGKDWKLARCVCAEMIQFVCQLHYYICIR